MKAQAVKILLCLTALLFSFAYAGRFQDVAHRKGMNEQLHRKREAARKAERPTLEERGNPSKPNHRYYTNETAPYFVESLPDVPQELLTEMYSGLIPIDMKNASRALFYVFQPKIGTPVDEITIWFNGGPGCSSLEGFFQENGFIQWAWGQYSPTANPYSWINLTNVLWVEYPVGVGFSIGDVTASTEEEIAIDFTNFFANFQEIFGIENYKIYVTGESYAGRYVPYVASAILDRNDTTHFNLSGALAYDPCIGSYIYQQNQVVAVPFAQQQNLLLGLNESYMSDLASLHESCGYADYVDQYLVFPSNGTQPPLYFNYTSQSDCDVWGSIYTAASAPNPCFNVYETVTQCPLPVDPLGYPTNLLYSYPGNPVYFNRTDVKKAMHAPDIDWNECSGPVFIGEGGPEDEGDLSADPIQYVLPRVIEATNRVLIANGQYDFAIITNGTLLSIQNCTWNGAQGFQSRPTTPIDITLPDLQYQGLYEDQGYDGIDNPQGIMGVQHYERGLMWAETYLSGHMQPQFQPRSAYRHLQWVLGHIETL